MSQIRIPSSGNTFLQFCRPWPESRELVFFETYADLMVFATGIGFQKIGQSSVSTCSGFLDQPNPISLDVFKSLQTYSILLLVGLAVTNDHRIARDEKRLCGFIEDYAASGFLEMKRMLENTTPEEFHVELSQYMVSSTSDNQL